MGLSRPNEDKLAACGAVAKILSKLMNDEYIAGHFYGNLISSLPWMIGVNCRNRDRDTQRGRGWRAPSWSWASMDCAVSIGGDNDNDDINEPDFLRRKPVNPFNFSSSLDESKESEESDKIEAIMETRKVIIKSLIGPCAQLTSANVELMDPSYLYGALKSAAITVQGPVTEVEHDTTHNAQHREVQSCVRWPDNNDLISVTFDDPNEPRNKLAILLTHMRRDRMESLGDNFKHPGPSVRGPEPLVSGLVLSLPQKGSGGEYDVYRRVGAF